MSRWTAGDREETSVFALCLLCARDFTRVISFSYFIFFLTKFFLSPKTFCIEVEPINNVVVVSGEH